MPLDIVIINNGLDSVEVSDNGKGIPSDHYVDVASRYTTSKLVEVEDLNRVTSFGFRGEGLNSLCSVAKVSMVTRTKDDATATSITFDEQGMFVPINIHAILSEKIVNIPSNYAFSNFALQDVF
jgi:DNA mismatch repair protein PMS2